MKEFFKQLKLFVIKTYKQEVQRAEQDMAKVFNNSKIREPFNEQKVIDAAKKYVKNN